MVLVMINSWMWVIVEGICVVYGVEGYVDYLMLFCFLVNEIEVIVRIVNVVRVVGYVNIDYGCVGFLRILLNFYVIVLVCLF